MGINILLAKSSVDRIIFADKFTYKLPEDADKSWKVAFEAAKKQEQINKRNKLLGSVTSLTKRIVPPLDVWQSHISIYIRIAKSLNNVKKLILNKEKLRERPAIKKWWQTYVMKKEDSYFGIWTKDFDASQRLDAATKHQMSQWGLLTRQFAMAGLLHGLLKGFTIKGLLDGLFPRSGPKRPRKPTGPKKSPHPTWTERIKALLRKLWNWFKNLWKRFKGIFKNFPRYVKIFLKETAKYIFRGIKRIGTVVSKIGRTIGSRVASAAPRIGRFFTKLLGPIVTRIIKGIGEAIRKNVQKGRMKVKTTIKGAKRLGGKIGRIATAFASLLKDIPSLLGRMGATIASGGAAVGAALTTTFGGITGQLPIRAGLIPEEFVPQESIFHEGGKVGKSGLAFLHDDEIIVPQYATLPQNINIDIGKVKIMKESDIKLLAKNIVADAIRRVESW